MPGLPQSLAILEARRPLKGMAASLGCQRLHGLGLIAEVAVVVAVKLEQQRGRDRIVRLRMPIDGVHLRFVEELETCHRHTELNRRDDGFDRGLHAVERADGGSHRLRPRVQPDGDFRDDAERAFGADEEPRKVVAGGRLSCARAGLDRPAIGEDHRQAEHVFSHGAVADGCRA